MKKSYSCISLLPETALEELEKLQDKIYTLTGSKLFRQQRPLHFTVWVGNDLEDIQLQDICLELQSIASRQHPFEISLGWLQFIEHSRLKKPYIDFEPYVVWIEICSTPQLQQLVDEIDGVLRRYDISFEIIPYVPHITLAGRDLDQHWFELLQKELKGISFSDTILIDNFSLVLNPCKENNISSMQETKRFVLWE